jgi:hypothetical protein
MELKNQLWTKSNRKLIESIVPDINWPSTLMSPATERYLDPTEDYIRLCFATEAEAHGFSHRFEPCTDDEFVSASFSAVSYWNTGKTYSFLKNGQHYVQVANLLVSHEAPVWTLLFSDYPGKSVSWQKHYEFHIENGQELRTECKLTFWTNLIPILKTRASQFGFIYLDPDFLNTKLSIEQKENFTSPGRVEPLLLRKDIFFYKAEQLD